MRSSALCVVASQSTITMGDIPLIAIGNFNWRSREVISLGVCCGPLGHSGYYLLSYWSQQAISWQVGLVGPTRVIFHRALSLMLCLISFVVCLLMLYFVLWCVEWSCLCYFLFHVFSWLLLVLFFVEPFAITSVECCFPGVSQLVRLHTP